MNTFRSFLLLVWARAGRTTHLPDELLIAMCSAGAATALVAWPPSWRRIRHLITLLHELGHMAAAALFGRTIVGVQLHRDSSGMTSMLGPSKRRFSAALISFAGYPAPAAVGFALAEAVRFGRADLAIALLAGALLAMAMRTLNLWGALVVALGLLVTLVAEVEISPRLVAGFVLLLAALAVAGSARALSEQHRLRLSGRITDTSLAFDVLGVSRRLHLPVVLVDGAWWLCWILLAGGALVAAAGVTVWR